MRLMLVVPIAITCAVLPVLGCAMSTPHETSARVPVNGHAGEWDCFAAAGKSGVPSLGLISPGSLAWNRSTEPVIALPFKLRNLTEHEAMVNVRASTNVSPLPGDDEMSVVFVDSSGKPWQRSQQIKRFVEGGPATARDYVAIAAGQEVPLTVRLSSSEYSLPTGDYIVRSCYWDRSDRGSLSGGRDMLRGPSLGQPFRLSVSEGGGVVP